MIIDNPHVMREVIQETNARFTHPFAEEIYTVEKDRMDSYAARWGQLADRIWKEEYQVKQSAGKAEIASESEDETYTSLIASAV
jgi:hypothetical protein